MGLSENRGWAQQKNGNLHRENSVPNHGDSGVWWFNLEMTMYVSTNIYIYIYIFDIYIYIHTSYE